MVERLCSWNSGGVMRPSPVRWSGRSSESSEACLTCFGEGGGPGSSRERKRAHCSGAEEEEAVLGVAGVPRAWPSLPLGTGALTSPAAWWCSRHTRVTDGQLLMPFGCCYWRKDLLDGIC